MATRGGSRPRKPAATLRSCRQGAATSNVQDVRYEPDERPPLPVSVGLGLQYVAITAASIVLTPALLVRAAGGRDDYLTWVEFSALVVSGATTVIQVVRIGRLGSGPEVTDGSNPRRRGIA